MHKELIERLRVLVANGWATEREIEAADAIERLQQERDDALKLSHATVTRGREVERQMEELRANFKMVAQVTHDSFTETIDILQDQVKHWQADSAAGWDKCEERKKECMLLRDALARILNAGYAMPPVRDWKAAREALAATDPKGE